jgi:tRNA nucleotidyltransferase/poly(A) polymerase
MRNNKWKSATRKSRVYVDHPENAPDDVEVQTGEYGGTFYYPKDESPQEQTTDEESEVLETVNSENVVSDVRVTIENTDFETPGEKAKQSELEKAVDSLETDESEPLTHREAFVLADTLEGEEAETIQEFGEMKERRLRDQMVDEVEIGDEFDGFAPFIVGGAVRDHLLGESPEDIDLMAIPEDDSIDDSVDALSERMEYIDTESDFPVFLDSQGREVALPRREESTGPGFSDFEAEVVSSDKSVEEALDIDLERRDMTLGAIAVNARDGEMVDPHDGNQSLLDREIRPVTDAFDEDPVRLFRTARFAPRFNLDVGDEIYDLAEGMKEGVEQLPDERAKKELEKTMKQADDPGRFFEVLDELDVISESFPVVETKLQSVRDSMENFRSNSDDTNVLYSGIGAGLEDDSDEFIEEHRLSNEEEDYVKFGAEMNGKESVEVQDLIGLGERIDSGDSIDIDALEEIFGSLYDSDYGATVRNGVESALNVIDEIDGSYVMEERGIDGSDIGAEISGEEFGQLIYEERISQLQEQLGDIDLTQKDNPEGIPDDAEYLRPGEDPPEGHEVVEGPEQGRYAVSPRGAAGERDIEDPDDASTEADEESQEDYVDTEHGKVPDTPGPLTPEQRSTAIGSEGHPVLWERPDDEEEFQEYKTELQDTEWFGEGADAFDRSFFGDDNTENEYKDEEGNWDEERLEKHKEWSEELLNENAATDEDEQPIGMILLGPPGAGKGWWQEQVEEGEYGETGEFVEREFTAISSDRTKEPIPEYNETNASEVHDEASKMAKDNLAPRAFEDEHNVIIDKVATSPDSTMDMIDTMEEKGYDIRASFVGVPKEKAAFNAVGRYYDEGRFTPLEFIDGAVSASQDSFDTIVEEAEIPDEKVGVFDNDVEWGNSPEPIKVGEDLLKFYSQFFGWDIEQTGTNKTIEDVLTFGGSSNGKARTRRNEKRNNGVDGGVLYRGGDGGNRKYNRFRGRVARRVTPPKDLRKEDTVGAETVVSRVTVDAVRKENTVKKISVNGVRQAPQDTIVSHDEDTGLYYKQEVDNQYLVDWKSTAEKIPDSVMKRSDDVLTLLTETYEKQVWPDDLSKAPRTWEGNEDVSKTVKDYVSIVVEQLDPLHGDYKGVPYLAAQQVEEEVKASLTQPQGWSTNSVAKRIRNEFDWMDKRQSEKIARMEVAAVLNTAKSVMFRAAEPQDEMWEYDWVGPDDANTTKICDETKEEIERRGGQVPLDVLQDVLREKAREYRSEGGTPSRVEEYIPHFECRHTLERVD